MICDTQHFLCSASFSNAHHLFDEITVPATRLSFPHLPDSFTHAYGSCDGLLVVENERKDFVLNPITGEMKEIPPWPFPKENFGALYGLGYDSAADDYKVVTICSYNAATMYEPDFCVMYVYVCSVKNVTWKTVEGSYSDRVVDNADEGMFVDGYVHWLARKVTDKKSAIVAFDLAEETFHEVPTPSSIDNDNFVFNHLVVLGGCLCISNEVESYIWVMKEYGVEESWTKFSITDPQAGTWPLCLLGQEQLVMFDDYQRFVVYNLKQGTLKNIVIDGGANDLYVEGSFVESLISPHGGNETDAGRD